MARFSQWTAEDMEFLEQVGRFAEIMDGWFGDGGQPVARDVAIQRAQRCVKCPKNKRASGPLSIAKRFGAEVVRSMVELKNVMRLSVPKEHKLHECDVCNCVLAFKIHVPLKHLVTELPSNQEAEFRSVNCWITEEKDKYHEL